MTDENFNFVIQHETKIFCREDSCQNLSPFIDEEYFEISNTASILHKQDVLNWLNYGDESIRTAKNFKARYISADVIQLNYISYIKESALTAVKSCYRSSLWKKIDDSWKVCFHQATSCQ